MEYTRNYNPNFYEEKQRSANCGSFAFQIKEWYSPDKYFEDDCWQTVEEWIEEGFEFGHDEFDLSETLANIFIDYVLADFEDVRYLWSPDDVRSDEELIAFRTFVDSDCNWDFHFKVFRDGRWQEKCGGNPVRFCDEWDWHNGILNYISSTFYLARKVA